MRPLIGSNIGGPVPPKEMWSVFSPPETSLVNVGNDIFLCSVEAHDLHPIQRISRAS